MRIFLLAITILLLISRIKSTPRMLSKTLYYAKLSKILDNNKKAEEGKDENIITIVHSISMAITLLVEALMIVYYLLVGNRFLSNTVILILTALQIVTVFITCRKHLNVNAFSQNIEDYKFYRFYFLFNVVLDYIYYPMVIYLLIV